MIGFKSDFFLLVMVALIFVGMSDNVGSDENGIPIEPLSQVIGDVIIEHVIIEPIEPVVQQLVEQPPVPILRKYEIVKTNDLWHAGDPSSYIDPNSVWVKYYIDNDLHYAIIYRTDDGMYPNDSDGDVWQNVDYTLYTKYGDCEDTAIVYTSIDIAKGRKAVVVGGYVTLDDGRRIRDFWEEVVVDDIKSLKMSPVGQTQKELRLEPLYIFNDKITWSAYNENWYK